MYYNIIYIVDKDNATPAPQQEEASTSSDNLTNGTVS